MVVNQIIHSLLCRSRVDHQVLWKYSRRVIWELVENGVSKREQREVSPDVVRAWIRQDYVFKPASRDLVIVGGVTPSTNAGGRIIKEIGVVKVMGI